RGPGAADEVGGAAVAGERDHQIGPGIDHLLVADGAGGAAVPLPVRGVCLNVPLQQVASDVGGLAVGSGSAAVHEGGWRGLVVLLQDAADGGGVAVVASAGDDDAFHCASWLAMRSGRVASHDR